MRFAAFITCILILLSVAVPVYALSTAERRQDGVIIVRTVKFNPRKQKCLAEPFRGHRAKQGNKRALRNERRGA